MADHPNKIYPGWFEPGSEVIEMRIGNLWASANRKLQLAAVPGWLALVLGASVANAGAIGESGSFPLASCKGLSATLTELTGKDTDRAVMRGVFTEADARRYCARDPGDVTVEDRRRPTFAECIVNVLHDAQLAMPPNVGVSASADCKRGIVVSAERQYQLVGIDRHSSDAELIWKDIRAGAVLGSGCGEGTSPISAQFRMMCPATAPVGIGHKPKPGASAKIGSQGGSDLVRNAGFRTPSKQIHCMFVTGEGRTVPDGVSCEINQGHVRKPIRPRPADCKYDWGHSFELGNESDANLICASDSVSSSASRLLAYGHSMRGGKIVCSSEKTGLTCKNANGHGFFLSRTTQRIF